MEKIIMGMEFPEAEKPDYEAERAAALAMVNKAKEDAERPSYIQLGAIVLNGEVHQLLVGEKDKRWYKAKLIGQHRNDEKNRSPLVNDFGEVEPFTEEDQKHFM